MSYYDGGLDPQNLGSTKVVNRVAQVAPVPASTKRTLALAQAKAAPGAVGELEFVIQLIEQVEALRKEHPDAEISLSVDGKWEASLVGTETAQKNQAA